MGFGSWDRVLSSCQPIVSSGTPRTKEYQRVRLGILFESGAGDSPSAAREPLHDRSPGGGGKPDATSGPPNDPSYSYE